VDPASIRPLSVGEILDAAITIFRSRAATMMKAVLVVVAPVQALSAVVALSAQPDDFVSETDPVTGATNFEVAEFIGFVVAALGVAALGVVATQLATGACLKSVAGAYLEGDPDWKETLRFARSRLGSLIWLSILYGVGLLFGFLLCIVPGVWLFGAWAVATPVMLIEERKAGQSLSRSRALVKGRWGPSFLVVLIGFILAGIVQTVLEGLLAGVLLSSANDVVRAVGSAITATLSSTLVTPFTAAVGVVLYFDLRVRKEGFDLELLAHRVGIEPPEGTTFVPRPSASPEDDDRPPFWPPPPGWRPRAP
jgi:hypothetical protein